MLQGCFSSCATKQNCHRTLRDPFTQKEIWYQTYWSCFLIPLSLFKTKGRSTSCCHTLSESYFATVSSSKQQHKTTKYQILSSSLFWGHTGLLLQAEWSYMRRCLLNTESCLQRGNKPVGRHCAIQVGGHARQGSQATAHAPSLGAAARICSQDFQQSSRKYLAAHLAVCLCFRGRQPLKEYPYLQSFLQPHEVIPDLCKLTEADPRWREMF